MDQRQLRQTIAAAKTGDPEAYKELLEAYGSRLYGYFLRATRSHHDAEDLLGELMLRLVRRLKSYDERGRFEPWLFRIAANMVRDRIRRMRTRPEIVSISGTERQARPLSERLPGTGPPVEAAILREEADRKLTEALDRLDETTRQMILLRYLGEMSFKDLAEVFQCPLGTALARVHRGLRILREDMGEEYGIE